MTKILAAVLISSTAVASNCPGPDLFTNAGTRAVKFSEGCAVDQDLFCRTLDGEMLLGAEVRRLQKTVEAYEASVRQKNIENLQLQGQLLSCGKDLEIAAAKLDQCGAISSIQCPPCAPCDWVKPAASGFGLGALMVGAAWLLH